MKEEFVLFGAGSAGRYALKYLREQGINPLCFADNYKGGDVIEGVVVLGPKLAAENNPDATWIACAISRPAATEIRAQMKEMRVKTKPLYECIPVFHGLPPQEARDSISHLCGDVDSMLTFNDQCIFRKNPDYDTQDAPTPCSEIYFPDFITRIEEEVFVDCGACDGDTVQEFLKRWPKFKSIVAFEPDTQNFNKLIYVQDPEQKGRITTLRMATGDHDGEVDFTANGDYSSHLSSVEGSDASLASKVAKRLNGEQEDKVRLTTLDKMLGDVIPTYIKADIEGSELDLLWGARQKIKQYQPVLAICAYHTSDHIWEIPLLIHAINPTYKLFFRRYAEGAWEIVWYGVPPDRIKETKPWSDISYSDNHTG